MSTDKILSNFGGQGDVPRGSLSRSDMRRIETALKNDWEIPEVLYRALPSKLAGIFADEKQNTRNRLTAAKILMSMKTDNRETLKMDLQLQGQMAEENSVNVSQEVNIRPEISKEDLADVFRELGKLGVIGPGIEQDKPGTT